MIAPKYSPNLQISEHVSNIAAINGRLSFTRAFSKPFELARFDIKLISASPLVCAPCVDEYIGLAQSKHDKEHKNSKLALSSTNRWKQHNNVVASVFLLETMDSFVSLKDFFPFTWPTIHFVKFAFLFWKFFSMSRSLASVARKTKVAPKASLQ